MAEIGGARSGKPSVSVAWGEFDEKGGEGERKDVGLADLPV